MAHKVCRIGSFLLVASLFLFPSLACGQARTEGQLTGIVLDPSGAAVPGATLTVSQPTTGFTTTVTSSASGQYTVADLQPGTYQLTASAKGFSDVVEKDVVIAAARITDLKVQMKIGASSETVEVSAASQVLETTANTLATTINPDSVQDLPLAGRDVLPFAQLVQGAQVGGDQRFTTYNALPNGAINLSVDGTNNNFQRYRSSTTGFFEGAGLRLGAIDEVTVSTSDLTADAGAEGGVTLRFTTKRGTNSYHGNAFWEAYNSAFNANSFGNDAFLDAGLLQQGRKQPSHTNDFGGSLGGPIIKNRLFGFFNFEWENQPSTGLFSPTVLSPAAQAGTFTYTRADNGAQQTVDLFNIAANANKVGAGGPYPFAVNSNISTLLGQINTLAQKGTIGPVTTDAYTQSLLQTTNFTAAQNTKQRWPTARVDYNITPDITWHTSYDLYWRTYPRTPIYPDDPLLEGGFQSSYSTFATGVDWTINSHLVNQANFGILNTQEEFQPGNSFSAFKGINFLPSTASFAVGGTAFTPPVPVSGGILPEPRNNPVWNGTDNLTWTRGSHTFTFGGDFRFSNQHDVGTQPPIAENLGISSNDPIAAMFNTTPIAGCTADTGGCFPGGLSTANNNEAVTDAEALYTALTGRVSSISGSLPLNTANKTYQSGAITSIQENQKVGGFYFQDSWKVNTHLALNYGFRWQFSGAITNTNNYFTSPTYANLLGPSTALFQPGQLNGIANPQIAIRPQPYKGDYKQPAPNFGFAWNPDFENGFLGKAFGGSNTVIRGGAAVSWYDEGWVTWENVAAGSLSNESVFLFPGQFTPGTVSFDPTGASLPALGSVPANGFQLPMSQAALTFTGDGNQSTVDPNIRSPYIENWNLGIQRKLPGDTVLEINYVGNHSVHMWEGYDLNEGNIFQNVSGFDSFLQDFKNAQLNLAASGGTTFAGPNPTPILTQAFQGSASSFQNPGFLFDVSSGQAGTLAGAIASSPAFFCNLVGNTFSPCVTQGVVTAGQAPTPKAYPINFFEVNPYSVSSFANSLTVLSDPGSESYNGLQVSVKHPVGHGLTLQMNYAYSHAFTNRYLGDYFTADSALVDFVTLRNPSLNRVPSPYDLRHTFRTFFTYDLPFGPGKMWSSGNSLVNKAIGGWTLGNILTWQIGRNFKLSGGQNTYNFYNDFAPDANDSGVVLNGVSVSQLQNAVGVKFAANPFVPALMMPQSLFGAGGAVQPETTPGQEGSIIFLHGPVWFNDDLSIIKNVPIWEHVNLKIYAEFLNVFNHPSFNYTDNLSFGTNNPAQYLFVNQYPYSPATVGQTGNRQIQFRMQLNF